MQGSGVTQPVKFLANETPLLVIAKWEKLLTLALRLKKVMNFLVFSSFLPAIFHFFELLLLKKQIDASFLSSVLLLMMKWHHNIAKVCCGSTRPWQQFNDVMTSFYHKDRQ